MVVPPEQAQVVGELPFNMKNGIIIFQKNEELGKVKTRLAASIGDEGALEAYQQLTSFTHRILKESFAKKILFFSSYIPQDIKKYQGNYSFEVQSEGGLGEKMKDAFRRIFNSGFEKLVIVGTDCPEISNEIIKEAFLQLENNDVVIGPANDGGYYLLGMNKLVNGVFEDIPWSTDEVANLTKDYLELNNFSYSLLPILSDIDYEEDWDKFKSMI